MSGGGRFVRAYLDRVVNRRDVSAVDELVDPGYHGGGFGWPSDREALRAFYAWQAEERPDWRIDVQETVEVGDCVVVRAHAGGTVVEQGVRAWRGVEWLAAYRLVAGRVVGIEVLALRERPAEEGWALVREGASDHGQRPQI